MKAESVTSNAANSLFVCENCGALGSTSYGWPAGWIRTGRSRRRVLERSPQPTITACWCPQCQHCVSNYLATNPSEIDVLHLAMTYFETWAEVQQAMQRIHLLRSLKKSNKEPNLTWKSATRLMGEKILKQHRQTERRIADQIKPGQ